jgi:hypothetical protein
MRKTAIIMAVALLAACGAAAQGASVQSWKSGKTTITLNGETLTVSGKGAMEDYDDSFHSPWCHSEKTIISLVVEVGVTSIGDFAFAYCPTLTSVTIPYGVTKIGVNAFLYCVNLTSVTIPNSVNVIELGAFAGCENLTSITIPNSVTNIDEGAFFQSPSLTSINVASDNTNYSSVDGVLFNKDKSTLIIYPMGKKGAYTIPQTVTKLGEIAFKDCLVTSITCLNPVPPIADVQSLFFRSDICLYVPENSIAAYRDADRWKYKFKCIKAIESAPK